MKNVIEVNNFRIAVISVASLFLLGFAVSNAVSAQTTKPKDSPHEKHNSDKSTNGNQSLTSQIRDLQIKVTKLETALKQKHAGKMGFSMQNGSKQGMKSKGMEKKGGMRMGSMAGQRTSGMGMMSGKIGMMSGQGMGGKGMSGMAMMGQMKGMGQMQMPSALPGFAGASHIYHIGSTGFFLDHSQHITLTQEQQVKLNQIKEKVLLGQATFDRWLSQAEQELWVLTSSDAPDAVKIEAKIREIEKLRSDKRIAYIRSVGEATGILTDEQRQALVGNLPPDHKATVTN